MSLMRILLLFADILLDSGYVSAVATYLQEQLDFHFFGFDVIVEAGTGMLIPSHALSFAF